MQGTSIEEYVAKAIERKMPEEEIRSKLITAGWDANEVEKALGKSDRTDDLEVPIPGRPDIKTGSVGMWDSFQHILMFISLYVLAISIGLMIHFYIDKFVPGVSSSYSSGFFSSDYRYTLLKGETATVIVSFPVYAFLFLAITKRTLRQPQIRNLKSRKFLIYLTLVVTFIIVIANIISLVYGFLNGNVTTNFFLHFLDTVGISGAIFGYYLHQVKEDRKANA